MKLLDKIAEMCGASCLSDMRYNGLWKSEIRKIDSSAFTLKEWNDTVFYLCHDNKNFDTVEQAKDYLMKY